MELVEGPVSFVDTRNNRREGRVHLKPVQAVTAGVPFGRRTARRSQCVTTRRNGLRLLRCGSWRRLRANLIGSSAKRPIATMVAD